VLRLTAKFRSPLRDARGQCPAAGGEGCGRTKLLFENHGAQDHEVGAGDCIIRDNRNLSGGVTAATGAIECS
jgi:hypothetical protein